MDLLWENLDAGEPPYPFEVRSHGVTEDERAALRRQVLTGRFDPRVEEWLTVLARPRCSIDSVFRPEPGAAPVRALAAAGHGTAVLAVQRESGLSLRPIEPGGLVSAIVELLPPAPRGTERSVSVPTDEFARVGTRITALPGLRGGQIAANSRDPLGGRRRSPVLAWIDNATGRYLGQVRPAMDGRQWTTVAPADAPTLRKRITELMTSVTDHGR